MAVGLARETERCFSHNFKFSLRKIWRAELEGLARERNTNQGFYGPSVPAQEFNTNQSLVKVWLFSSVPAQEFNTNQSLVKGVSVVGTFYELLRQPSFSVFQPDENKAVAPIELCPLLKKLYKILISRELSTQAILQALRDETMSDPRDCIEIAQSHAFYRPSVLSQP